MERARLDGGTVMDRVRELYQHYWGQVMTWYDGLNELYQYGVLFLLIIAGLFVAAYFILSRITK